MSATTYIDEATLREPSGWDGVLDLTPLPTEIGVAGRYFRANDGSMWRSTMATRAITYVRRETGR